MLCLDLAVEGTRKFLEGNPNASVAEIVELVTNQQMASALKAHDKIHIFVRAAITPQFFKNKEIEIPSGASPELGDLITKLLIKDPN